MIKLIGFKRLIFLACMVALNLSVLGVYFFSIGQMLDDVTSQKSTVDGQISELRGKIGNIKQDMAFAKDNLPKYNELKDKGFFQNQDRFAIDRIMKDLRAQTGISNFNYDVSALKEIPNADADAVNYRLIDSHIKVDKIISPLDTNIYILAQALPHVFPPYARIQKMDITRAAEVNEQALKDISEGKPVNFVNANIEFDWITMVPKPEAAASPANTPAGFRGQ